MLDLFSVLISLSRVRVYKATALCYTTQLEDGVVELRSYTEDSGNATLPVCHCDHNKINAAAVTKYSLYPPSKFVTLSMSKISVRNSIIWVLRDPMLITQKMSKTLITHQEKTRKANQNRLFHYSQDQSNGYGFKRPKILQWGYFLVSATLIKHSDFFFAQLSEFLLHRIYLNVCNTKQAR
jgi:hypothetical protein